MEVRWFKDGIEAPVYFYTLQNTVSSIQPDGYRDRAHIFIEELSVGNLSLQLSNIQTSDSGRYICSVIHKTKYAHAVVDLKVTGDAKSPSWLIVLPWFVIPIFIAIVAYCLSTKCRKGDAKSPSWLIVLPWFVIPIFIAIVAYCLSTKCRKADVTLDPETASPSLFLSEDHKEVRLGTEEWEYDRTLMKQKKWYSVLGTEGFASGRHYWEVEVGEKQNWRLGVGEKSSGGTEPLNWTLGLRKGEFENDLGNHSSPSELRIVRVTLDMEGRQLSFFNAETSSEIHTVSVAKATGKLYPYFSPGGWDRDPLLIFDLNPEKLIKNNRISQSEIS
ncbi:UNVERIFIED_CONTAM: hypothetical protein FKN15_008449 [Acipenser sinensis]